MATVVPRRRGRHGGSYPRRMMHPVTRRVVGPTRVELCCGGNASLQSPGVRPSLPCSLPRFAVGGRVPLPCSHDSELYFSVPEHACYSSIPPASAAACDSLLRTVSSLPLQRYPRRFFCAVSHIRSTGSFSYKLGQITYGEILKKRNVEARKQD